MQGEFWRRRGLRVASVSLLVLGLSACAQMTRHSNTLVFATNTIQGLKIGADEKQLPTIQFGHTRQEAAFVPVLANTASGKKGLIPCPSATALKDDNSQNVTMDDVDKCKFVATHDGKSEDAYSTLASFGSKAVASAAKKSDGTYELAGESAIAQYFATGIAAQYLAVTGGANVVQAGGDTAAKASAAATAAQAVKDAEVAKIAAANEKIKSGYSVALVIMGNDPKAPVTDSMMDSLETAIKTPGCTKAKFKSRGYPIGSVESFLDKLNKDNPTCLIKLIPRA